MWEGGVSAGSKHRFIEMASLTFTVITFIYSWDVSAPGWLKQHETFNQASVVSEMNALSAKSMFMTGEYHTLLGPYGKKRGEGSKVQCYDFIGWS